MPEKLRGIPDSDAKLEITVKTRKGDRLTSDFYYGGLRETLKVVTDSGYSIEGTSNHKVIAATDNGPQWMCLDQLNSESYVAIWRETPEYSFEFDSFAYFLGLYTGDGCRVKPPEGRPMTAVVITNPEPEVAEFILSDLPKLGLTASKRKSKDRCDSFLIGRRSNGSIPSGGVAKLMRDMGETFGLSTTKTVPRGILIGSLSQKRSYLIGLFDTDGSSSGREGYIELTLSNKEIVEDVQIMLLQFGIISNRAFKQPKSWRLTITGVDARFFYERIGFRVKRKQANQKHLANVNNTNKDIIPCLGNGLLREYVRQTENMTVTGGTSGKENVRENVNLLEKEFSPY